MRVRRSEVRRAAKLYQAFREAKPGAIRRVEVDLPRAAAIIGTVEFVGYVTTHAGRTHLYIHEFSSGSRPYLAAGTRQNQALLVGGRYRVTARGIQDLDRNGRAVHGRPRYKVEVV